MEKLHLPSSLVQEKGAEIDGAKLPADDCLVLAVVTGVGRFSVARVIRTEEELAEKAQDTIAFAFARFFLLDADVAKET